MNGPYPPGTTGHEDYLWRDEDPPCACDHPQSDHDEGGFGACQATVSQEWAQGAHGVRVLIDSERCPCEAFEPPGAYS